MKIYVVVLALGLARSKGSDVIKMVLSFHSQTDYPHLNKDGCSGFAVSLYQKLLPQKYNDPFTTNIYSNPLKSFGEVIVPNSKGYSDRSAWIMFFLV